MSRLATPFCLCATLVLLLVAGEQPARAYADPGSGALIWQGIAAGLVGLMFYFRRFAFWRRSRRKDFRS
jgi:hypothetical protein